MSDIGPKRTLLNRMDRITIEALENWTPRSNKGGGRVSYQVSSRQAVVRQRRRDNVPRERCNDACLFSSNVATVGIWRRDDHWLFGHVTKA